MAEGYCAKAEACMPFYFNYGFGTTEVCVEYYRRGCETQAALPGVSASYKTWAKACIEKYANVGDCRCPIDEVCDAMAVGTLPNGSACADDGECTSTVCTKLSDADCGTCQDPAALDATCGTDLPECGAGLYCDDTAGQCRAKVGVGAQCEQSDACDAPYSCVGGVCGFPLGEGEDCTAIPAGCNLMAGLYCNSTTHLCTPYGFAGAGENCGVVSTSPVTVVMCLGNLKCTATGTQLGTCAARKAENEACTASVPEGTAPTDHDCLPYLYCPAGTCVPWTAAVCQ
jgi:hypothetical protein